MAWTERYVVSGGAGANDGTSEANAWDLPTMLSNYASGQRVNIKAGTYSSSTTDRTWSTAGTTTAPVWFRGYKSTIGDMDDHPTSNRVDATDIPLFTSTTGRYFINAAYLKFSNISFTSAYTGAGTVLSRGGESNWYRCKFETTSTAGAAKAWDCATQDQHYISECYFNRPNTNSPVIAIGASHVHIYSSVIRGGDEGIDVSGSKVVSFINNIFIDQNSECIWNDAAPYMTICGNIFYNPGTDAIEYTASQNTVSVVRNIFHTVGGYALNNSSGTDSSHYYIDGNVYYNINSGQLNGISESFQLNAIALSVDPFVDAANDDFNLNSTVNGGQTLRNETFAMPVS